MNNTSWMISLTHHRPISIFTILHQSWHVISEVLSVHSCQQLMPLALSLETARRLYMSLLSPSLLVNFLSAMTSLQSFPGLEKHANEATMAKFRNFCWVKTLKEHQPNTYSSKCVRLHGILVNIHSGKCQSYLHSLLCHCNCEVCLHTRWYLKCQKTLDSEKFQKKKRSNLHIKTSKLLAVE